MSRFVVVVDTQWDFMAGEGALSVAGAAALVAPMQAWLSALQPADVAGVLFTFDTHFRETYAASPEAAMFPIHCVRDTPGWANMLDIALLDPAIPAWRIEKGVFDMWAEPGLAIEDARDPGAPSIPREAFFSRLAAQHTTDVMVIGVAADYCVRWAVEGLVERGFAVTVPAGLTRGIERQIDTVAAEDFAGRRLTISTSPA
ncbi:nicotinamidase/pyrazinamidase [Sphingomonas aurantiaca]|jgi:nicotinamidase/pyrazinamidase|uniref:Nicotinamidase/pyrazinamidase n=2 Tax=Sphingomonas aurantiaca TaxID=185949 RepID=A0A2T5GP50_9SPHN|nr:isochorismatase family protein [Sphingomonas aurantiaca]PTQ61038.1 nicotinamidase/pyrazinamidase [Sphingomonas aurantiaca]